MKHCSYLLYHSHSSFGVVVFLTFFALVQTATMEDVERSDRELARLFVEMFDVIGEQVVNFAQRLQFVLLSSR